jgi:hypothetical protein
VEDPVISISPALAKSRLARAVQRGDSPERVAELRACYYAAKTRVELSGLIASGRLLPEHRAELAGLLTGPGGGDDVAA